MIAKLQAVGSLSTFLVISYLLMEPSYAGKLPGSDLDDTCTNELEQQMSKLRRNKHTPRSSSPIHLSSNVLFRKNQLDTLFMAASASGNLIQVRLVSGETIKGLVVAKKMITVKRIVQIQKTMVSAGIPTTVTTPVAQSSIEEGILLAEPAGQVEIPYSNISEVSTASGLSNEKEPFTVFVSSPKRVGIPQMSITQFQSFFSIENIHFIDDWSEAGFHFRAYVFDVPRGKIPLILVYSHKDGDAILGLLFHTNADVNAFRSRLGETLYEKYFSQSQE